MAAVVPVLPVGPGFPVGYRVMAQAPDTAAPPRRRLPGWVGPAARLAATIGLMAYVTRDLDLGEIRRTFVGADWRWWLAGLGLNIASQATAGIRWGSLARPLGFDLPRWLFVWRFFEGSFFNLCLPSSIGGDVVKAYRLGSSTQRRLLAGCSILADRLTGLAALGVLAGTALVAQQRGLRLPAAAGLAALLLGVAVLAFRLGVGSIDRLLSLIPAPHPARELIAKLLPYQERPQLMSQAIGWSFLVQAGGAAAVGLIARSLGVTQPPVVWFAVVPLIALVTVLPISINGVGVRENALAILLAPHGVSREPAVALGVLWLFTVFVTGLLGGLLFLIDRRSAAPA